MVFTIDLDAELQSVVGEVRPVVRRAALPTRLSNRKDELENEAERFKDR